MIYHHHNRYNLIIVFSPNSTLNLFEIELVTVVRFWFVRNLVVGCHQLAVRQKVALPFRLLASRLAGLDERVDEIDHFSRNVSLTVVVEVGSSKGFSEKGIQ